MTSKTNILNSFLCCLIFLIVGCIGPRGRWGFTPQVQYGDPNRLGTHSYTFSTSEGFGIFYTLRGGSIDLDHVRGVADLTRWTYIRAKATLEKGDDHFRVSPGLEWTTNEVQIQYPPNWDSLPQAEREKIAHAAALIIAPVVSYNSSIWHEMLTWKGTHFALIEPEHTSAFSWDDLYSNLTGVELAMQTIRDGQLTNGQYDQAMTHLIKQELDRLQVVPKKKAKEITESVRGTWHKTGRLMKRNMDIGYDDGMVSPSIIPGYTNQSPISRMIPTLDGLDELGIEIKYTIRSAYFENGKLKKIAGTKTAVEPLKHYPKIMENIEAEAIDKYGYTIR